MNYQSKSALNRAIVCARNKITIFCSLVQKSRTLLPQVCLVSFVLIEFT